MNAGGRDPLVSPCGKRSVDVGVVDVRRARGTFRQGHALPRPPGRQPPSDEVQEAMLAECAPRTPLGPREGRADTCGELAFRQVHGDRRYVRIFDRGAPHVRTSWEAYQFARDSLDFSTYDNRLGPFAKPAISSDITAWFSIKEVYTAVLSRKLAKER